MASRPVVSVFTAEGEEESVASTTKMPGVFLAPIRTDIVHHCYTNLAKNKRQPYCVNKYAGKMPSAASWGTGRAVSRIPRVQGGGTHRSGQGAFGNMCRGGRMFAPTKTWRKWHRKVNVTQKRHAIAAGLAASAVPALVMARGHKVDGLAEVPLVVSSGIEKIQKTRDAVTLLKKLQVYADVEKTIASRTQRAGKGKMRGRRFTQRRGPLVIYDQDNGLTKAFRNIPGVELASVHALNLLQLTPGGHLGRLIVWSQGAFEQLDTVYGTLTKPSAIKKQGGVAYRLPQPMMKNADLSRLINSDEVQSVVNAPKEGTKPKAPKANPLRNKKAMDALNPAAEAARKRATTKQAEAIKKKAALTEAKRKGTAKGPKADKAVVAGKAKYYKAMIADDS